MKIKKSAEQAYLIAVDKAQKEGKHEPLFTLTELQQLAHNAIYRQQTERWLCADGSWESADVGYAILGIELFMKDLEFVGRTK